ncbi:MAG: hypothetical protein WC744_05680 [Patescibacteria group bacterium]|jgi:ferritin-like protein
MSEETAGKGLPIIKNDVFGLTEKDVKKILKETQIDLEATRKALSDNLSEREKEFLGKHLPSVEAQFRALSAPPKTVLAKTKYFYDRTAELGKQGMNEDLILDQLASEFSDIGAYYGLLRLKPWGYHLGQGVFASRAKQSFKR